jgi:hypothetical protein
MIHTPLKWLSIAMLLAGCSASVPEWEIATGIEICRSRSGLAQIETFMMTMALCRDGSRHRIYGRAH